MEFVNLLIGVGVILVCVIVPVSIWFFISGVPEAIFDNVLWRKFKESEDAEESAEQALVDSVLQNGTLAPAEILSIHGLAHRKKSPGSSYRSKAIIQVEVKPEGKPAFQSQFEWWIFHTTKHDFQVAADNMLKKDKIWVMYNPENPAEMIFSHTDDEHAIASRRIEFNKLTKKNEELKKSGQSAEAIIKRVEDLDLPYPAKKSRAMRMEFQVTSENGASFTSQGNFLIGDSAIEKYSVGKKFFVRFDPQNPKEAVLDSERNKSLK